MSNISQKNPDTTFVSNLRSEKNDTMKKESTITATLGMKQIEVAQLLGINRSQWSMFESGKRDLPLPAKKILATLLSHAQQPKARLAGGKSALEKKILTEELKAQLLEATYQVERVSRLLSSARRKHEAKMNLSQIAESMHQSKGKEAVPKKISAAVARKVKGADDFDTFKAVVKLQLRLERLQHDKKFIEGKIGETTL